MQLGDKDVHLLPWRTGCESSNQAQPGHVKMSLQDSPFQAPPRSRGASGSRGQVGVEGSRCCSCPGLARGKGRRAHVLRCTSLLLTTQQCPGQPHHLLPALEISPQRVRPRDHRAPSLATVNCKCLGRCREAGDADSDFSQSYPFAATVSLCVWCGVSPTASKCPCSYLAEISPRSRPGSVLCCPCVLFFRWTEVFEFNIS